MYKSILVCLDGSTYSERAMADALELARLTGAKVTLATVTLIYKDAHVPAVPQLEERSRERADNTVHTGTLVQRLGDRKAEKEWPFLLCGPGLRVPIPARRVKRISIRWQEFLDIDVVIGLDIEADAFLAGGCWLWCGKRAPAARRIGSEIPIIQQIRVEKVVRQREILR